MSALVEDLMRSILNIPWTEPEPTTSKMCVMCEITHPIENFSQNKGGGVISSSKYCKKCRRSRQNAITGDRYKEKTNERSRKLYHDNLEASHARAKEYYSKNKHRKKKPTCEQKVRNNKRNKIRWWDRRDEELKRGRSYYAANKEKVEARIKEYRRLNPDVLRNYCAMRRAKIRGLTINVTRETIAGRIELYGHRCAYCGDQYEQLDHVKAVARNGMHSPANLRPACKACNLRKGKMSISDWKRLSGLWAGLPQPNLPEWWLCGVVASRANSNTHLSVETGELGYVRINRICDCFPHHM